MPEVIREVAAAAEVDHITMGMVAEWVRWVVVVEWEVHMVVRDRVTRWG